MSMKYVSTRGRAPELGFADVLLAGLATDGGLYVPESWPALPERPIGGDYASIAAAVMSPFVDGEIDADAFAAMCRDAYGTFRHPATTPLVQLGPDEWVLELFHGPTLAFKDVALQLVGRMFDHVLAQRSERLMIVGATSGDTGSAAIDGVKRCDNVDIVILYPYGRVSDVQRRQMTTVDAPNVHTVAIDGTFDDCQDLVKAMFNDAPFRERMRLSAVNSINWARVMAQVVYYVWACDALGASTRPISFSVPTGNFGNVLAGWIAREMGCPIEQLVIGSNSNDILTRFLETGSMTARDVIPTLSPSMDIQVSSNFERLLYEMNGRDGGMTSEQLDRFRASGRLDIEQDQNERHLAGVFRGERYDDEATIATIRDVYASSEMLLDPHTAVGIAAGRRWARPGVPMVSPATAHPAKFPDAVQRATGSVPASPITSLTCSNGPNARTASATTSPPSNGSSSPWPADHRSIARRAPVNQSRAPVNQSRAPVNQSRAPWPTTPSPAVKGPGPSGPRTQTWWVSGSCTDIQVPVVSSRTSSSDDSGRAMGSRFSSVTGGSNGTEPTQAESVHHINTAMRSSALDAIASSQLELQQEPGSCQMTSPDSTDTMVSWCPSVIAANSPLLEISFGRPVQSAAARRMDGSAGSNRATWAVPGAPSLQSTTSTNPIDPSAVTAAARNRPSSPVPIVTPLPSATSISRPPQSSTSPTSR
ncbi:MAG: threonine synthase [Ilumatobacteraceae bacterium]